MKYWLSSVALAVAAMGASPAIAQSSLTLYGLIDLSVDSVRKSQGDVQGTVFGLNGLTPVPNSVASPEQKITRLANSLTGQSHLGFRGTEDLGGGWQAKFQLEGALVPDNGGIGSDGRMFGRTAWVGLTTPVGEVRLGRQASPMLAAFYLNTLERLGSTDLLAAGVTANNLQGYQDNLISYLVRSGNWLGQVSYSPNAGVASRISAARASATSSTPVANETTGQIVGGASAGTESDSQRGRTSAAFLAYRAGHWTWVSSVLHNEFDAQVGLARTSGAFVPLFALKDYSAWMMGGKYRWEASGTEVALNVHHGRFTDESGADPAVRTFGLAVKQSWGALDLIAQAVDSRFTNFTEGQNRAYMLGLDYKLSRRTAVYARVGQLKDRRGDIVVAPLTPVPMAGGPAVLLVPLGALEIPYFSGAGANMNATTRLLGVGVRHSF
jgi:predicted porin